MSLNVGVSRIRHGALGGGLGDRLAEALSSRPREAEERVLVEGFWSTGGSPSVQAPVIDLFASRRR